MIGKKVLNPDGSILGTIMGLYDPIYYIINICKGDYSAWDKDHLGWKDRPVGLVYFEHPQRNLSKEEVAKYFSMEVAHVTDKLYLGFTSPYTHMYMPVDALNIET